MLVSVQLEKAFSPIVVTEFPSTILLTLVISNQFLIVGQLRVKSVIEWQLAKACIPMLVAELGITTFAKLRQLWYLQLIVYQRFLVKTVEK